MLHRIYVQNVLFKCTILLKRINALQTAWLQNHFYCVYIVIHVWAACFVQKLKSENTPQSTTIYSTDRNSGLIFMHQQNMANCIESVYDWWYLIAKKAHLLWWLQMHNGLVMWFGIKIEMLFRCLFIDSCSKATLSSMSLKTLTEVRSCASLLVSRIELTRVPETKLFLAQRGHPMTACP